jgi:ankyrin repeat protein
MKPLHPPDSSAETGLFLAAANNQIDRARLLLPYINIDEENTLSRTALHAAAKAGHVEMVQLLLDNHASTNKLCSYGRTPLMIATIYGHVEVVELLRNHHASLEIADHDGNTALHLAVKRNQIAIVKIFINHSFWPKEDESIRLVNLFPPIPTVDIFKKNNYGKKAIELSKNESVDLLQKAEIMSDNLFTAIKNNDINNIVLILSYGARITDEMISTCQKEPEIIEWLSEADSTKSNMKLK